jgi:hypothetical protein
MTVKRKMAKKKVVKNFLSMYQSIFFMGSNKDRAMALRKFKKKGQKVL